MQPPSSCVHSEHLAEFYKLIYANRTNLHVSESSKPFWRCVFVFLAVIYAFISRESPQTCEAPACNNDPDFCPGFMICQPVPKPVFYTIDAICVYLFTIEYGVKLLTAWSVSSR